MTFYQFMYIYLDIDKFYEKFNIKYLHSIYIPIEVPPSLIHSVSGHKNNHEKNLAFIQNQNSKWHREVPLTTK